MKVNEDFFDDNSISDIDIDDTIYDNENDKEVKDEKVRMGYSLYIHFSKPYVQGVSIIDKAKNFMKYLIETYDIFSRYRFSDEFKEVDIIVYDFDLTLNVSSKAIYNFGRAIDSFWYAYQQNINIVITRHRQSGMMDLVFNNSIEISSIRHSYDRQPFIATLFYLFNRIDDYAKIISPNKLNSILNHDNRTKIFKYAKDQMGLKEPFSIFYPLFSIDNNTNVLKDTDWPRYNNISSLSNITTGIDKNRNYWGSLEIATTMHKYIESFDPNKTDYCLSDIVETSVYGNPRPITDNCYMSFIITNSDDYFNQPGLILLFDKKIKKTDW